MVYRLTVSNSSGLKQYSPKCDEVVVVTHKPNVEPLSDRGLELGDTL